MLSKKITEMMTNLNPSKDFLTIQSVSSKNSAAIALENL